MGAKKPWPSIMDWLAKFEKFKMNTTCFRTMREQYSVHLDEFVHSYPHRRTPESFTRADVENYLVTLKLEGRGVSKLRDVRRAISAMWRWMIEYHDLPVVNIADDTGKRLVPVRDKGETHITFEEYERFEREVERDEELRVFQEGLLFGEVRDVGLSTRQLQRRFRDAARRAGLPHLTIHLLKKELKTHLWAEILRRDRTPEYLRPPCATETSVSA